MEWPADKKVIDIGSFYADSTLFKTRTGWAPRIGLAEGLRRTIEYYRPRMAAVCLTRGACRSIALKPGEDRAAVEAAIKRVIDSGWFILGPEVEALRSGVRRRPAAATHAVGVGTGTDAITLTLRALDIGPGDEVITAPLSAAYSALAVMMAGARPVFADIDPDRLTLDPAAAAAAVTSRTRALLPVHLYGQPADMTPLLALAERHHLALVEDCAQAHLATSEGRPVGTMGVAGAFSFYPTKNLGALGDGGAVVDRRRGARRTHQAAAQWRPDHALSPPRSRGQQPPRRDAGGHPARAPRAPGRVDRPSARDRRGLPGRPLGARQSPCRRSSMPGTSTTCSRC